MEQLTSFRDMRGFLSFLTIKPVLLVAILVLSEIVPPEGQFFVEASNTGGTSFVNHNLLYNDATLRRKYDPYSDDALDLGKESGSSASSDFKRSRSRDRDRTDSEELERTGSASGHPLSTSARDNVADIRDETGCPRQFRKLCTCGFQFLTELKRNLYTVSCNQSGFTDADALESLPQNTGALIFTGHNIPSLPPNIFGTTKTYPELIYIDMSSNGIELILGKTFHRVNATETLILNNNKISPATLQDHQRIFSNFVNLKSLLLSSAFAPNPNLLSDLTEIFVQSNLTKLEKLHLEHNGIDYINEPSIFCELTSLMDLHMSQNELSDLNLDLTCLNEVRYIDLTYNKIRIVGENSGLWKLLHEKNKEGTQLQVNLLGNPFECDCKLDNFLEVLRNWTKTNPQLIPSSNALRCEQGFPNNNTGKYLMDVVQTECPLLQGSDFGSTAVSTISWILGILFLIVVGYFLYSNQNILCRPVSPLHQTTTQGVKYTSIQEEEAEVAHV